MLNAKISTFLCLLILSIISSNLLAQEYAYAIRMGGKDIGEITASRTETQSTETYKVLSNVDFKVLWKKYNRKTDNFVIYEDSAIKTSYSSISMNNKLEDSTAINWINNSYKCYRYSDKKKEACDSLVSYSSVKLYFEEPIGMKEIYSERFLAYCPIELIGAHKYKLYLPNGKENCYTYESGELIEVFVDRTWFNIRFQKI